MEDKFFKIKRKTAEDILAVGNKMLRKLEENPSANEELQHVLEAVNRIIPEGQSRSYYHGMLSGLYIMWLATILFPKSRFKSFATLLMRRTASLYLD